MGNKGHKVVALGFVSMLAACGTAPSQEEETASATEAVTGSVIKNIFIIVMENHDGSQIYGNTASAPYINNTLLPNYARSTNFNDELPSLASEPHYVWAEAGTNAFSDHTFTTDNDASRTNSTSSTAHLTTQIKNATNGVTWRTYQESINGTTGSCPIASSGRYAAKHNPYVFFRDVSGNPPSKTNAYCVAHTRAYSSFATDLANGDVANYTWITPNLCNDMHDSCAPLNNSIKQGDTWLSTELPRIISWANAHAGVVFITWDEGSATTKMPFLAVGPGVKANYAGSVSYTHSSLVKSAEAILELPTLSTVAGANALGDLFKAGNYP